MRRSPARLARLRRLAGAPRLAASPASAAPQRPSSSTAARLGGDVGAGAGAVRDRARRLRLHRCGGASVAGRQPASCAARADASRPWHRVLRRRGAWRVSRRFRRYRRIGVLWVHAVAGVESGGALGGFRRPMGTRRAASASRRRSSEGCACRRLSPTAPGAVAAHHRSATGPGWPGPGRRGTGASWHTAPGGRRSRGSRWPRSSRGLRAALMIWRADADAADVFDVAARHRLPVGDDGQRFHRGARIARRLLGVQPVQVLAHLGAALEAPARWPAAPARQPRPCQSRASSSSSAAQRVGADLFVEQRQQLAQRQRLLRADQRGLEDAFGILCIHGHVLVVGPRRVGGRIGPVPAFAVPATHRRWIERMVSSVRAAACATSTLGSPAHRQRLGGDACSPVR